MNPHQTKFQEFEHKYLLAESEQVPYQKAIENLNPLKSYTVKVTDWYFQTKTQPDHVYRYRRDKDYNQLTVKSLQKDSESRLEVNLDLSGQKDYLHEVRAFLSPQTPSFEGKIEKEVFVYYFSDCECVCYSAQFEETKIYCLELEVIEPQKWEDPRKVLSQYENKLGLDLSDRCPKSLFQLLIEPNISK